MSLKKNVISGFTFKFNPAVRLAIQQREQYNNVISRFSIDHVLNLSNIKIAATIMD